MPFITSSYAKGTSFFSENWTHKSYEAKNDAYTDGIYQD